MKVTFVPSLSFVNSWRQNCCLTDLIIECQASWSEVWIQEQVPAYCSPEEQTFGGRRKHLWLVMFLNMLPVSMFECKAILSFLTLQTVNRLLLNRMLHQRLLSSHLMDDSLLADGLTFSWGLIPTAPVLSDLPMMKNNIKLICSCTKIWQVN